ncbi:MAG TPA: hypothetical protein VK934_07960 [Fimbriimonas sp.]|nr:hypothetical protein [Fimbriimonas sp.]
MRRKIQNGGTGKISEMTRADSVNWWQQFTPEERFQAIIDARNFYHEVLKPGTGAKRLDRSIGGTRRLRD